MLPLPQVFYDEFGALMMRQPLFGLGFTTYAPLALLPYMACPTSGPASGGKVMLSCRRGAAARCGPGVLEPVRWGGKGDARLVCRAQALLLWVGVFNRLAGVFVRGGAVVWEDDYETRSPAAAQVQAAAVLPAARVLPPWSATGWWPNAVSQSNSVWETSWDMFFPENSGPHAPCCSP